MMSPEDYELYWQHAAERNNAIGHTESAKHFTTFTVEDVLTNLKSVVSPLLALEDPEYRTVDQQSDNVRLVLNGGILIIKKAPAGDYIKTRDAINEMFLIAYQMMTKLYNDRKKANEGILSSPENEIKHLDLNSVNMVPVGPVFDGWHGWRVNFSINSPANTDLDESKWTGETKWTF